MTLFEFVIVFLVRGGIILATVGNDRFDHELRQRYSYSRPYASSRLMAEVLLAVHPCDRGRNATCPDQGRGKWQLHTMRGMRIDPEDLMAAGRTKGVESIFEIKYVVLERNGAISIIKAEEK